jgi:hypothetical protein
MRMPDIPRSGRCGDRVWQRNRYAQCSYSAFIPFNPRTAEQRRVRDNFGRVSARWRQLRQEQRDCWIAVAEGKQSRPRLGQGGLLTGCQLFVQVNVARANRGMAQLDWPREAAKGARTTERQAERAIGNRGPRAESRRSEPQSGARCSGREIGSEAISRGSRRGWFGQRTCCWVGPSRLRMGLLGIGFRVGCRGP